MRAVGILVSRAFLPPRLLDLSHRDETVQTFYSNVLEVPGQEYLLNPGQLGWAMASCLPVLTRA